MKNLLVLLEPPQLTICGMVGSMRRVRSILDGLDKNKHAYKSDFETDFDGCCGECAVAKHYNRFWPMHVTKRGEDDYKRFDVGGYQVRATSWHEGHLIVRPNDELGQNYILAITSQLPNVRLVGVFNSTDAKEKKYRYTDAAGFEYWRVSQADLLDLPNDI